MSLHCAVPGGGQVGDLQGHELRLQRGPADNGPVGLSSHEAVASHGPGASSHSDLHGRPPEGYLRNTMLARLLCTAKTFGVNLSYEKGE